MSKELNLLLQRIHPVVETSEPSEPSENLLRLVSRVENRRWLSDEVTATEERFKEEKKELKFIRHALQCSRCLSELQIAIERYWGRSLPWYLDLTNEYWDDEDDDWNEENGLPEYYKDCPRVKNYEIGSYWNGASDDTIRFIKDRLKWAEQIVEKEVKVIRRYLRALRKWDLQSPLPPNSYIDAY